MAFVDLFIDKRPMLGHLVFDCSVSEQHEAGLELTQHPVEAGADLDDHARPTPRRVALTVIVSPTKPILGVQLRPDFDPQAHRTAWQELLALKDSGIPMILVTGHDSYMNMMFDGDGSLVCVREPSKSKAGVYQLRLREVEFGYTTLAEALAAEVADQAATKALKGIQGAREASGAAAAAAAGGI